MDYFRHKKTTSGGKKPFLIQNLKTKLYDAFIGCERRLLIDEHSDMPRDDDKSNKLTNFNNAECYRGYSLPPLGKKFDNLKGQESNRHRSRYSSFFVLISVRPS